MARRIAQLAEAWSEAAEALTDWASRRLVNRSDVYQTFLPMRKRREDEDAVAHDAQLTTKLIVKHFSGNAPQHLIAIASTSRENTTKWFAIILEKTSDDDPVTPGIRFQVALEWHERLSSLGFNPILEDADGQGTFRLIMLLDTPVDADHVGGFARQIVADYANLGLHAPPTLYPCMTGTPPHENGHWLKLPGRHHTYEAYSRIWNGHEWLEADAAIDALIAAKTTAPNFVRKLQPRKQPTHGPKLIRSEEERLAESVNSVDTLGDRAASPTFKVANAMEASLKVRNNDKMQIVVPHEQPAHEPEPEPVHTPAPEPKTQERVMSTIKSLLSRASKSEPEPEPTPEPEPQYQHQPQPEDISMNVEDAIATIAKRTGLQQDEIVRRLFHWFCQQDEVVQAMVLGQIPAALMTEVSRHVADRMHFPSAA